MSANEPTSATSPINEAAELFEDENEEFIRSLEETPPPKAEEKTQAPTQDHLDEVLPDTYEDHEDEDHHEADEEEDSEELVEKESTEEAPAKPKSPEVVEKEPLTKLDQVKVNIKLEVGKVSCSLQKLLALKENDVIELNQPIGQLIDLRVDGRLIGKGQIVRLGDQLGLRISELADR